MEDYEKLYKNAVKRIQTTYQDDFGCVRVKPEEIFPELKESDDERIRKSIIDLVEKQMPKSENKKWMIDWLEKQGEKIDVIENFGTEFEKQVSHLIASAINKEHEYNQSYVKWTANALLNYAKHELEKQGEQSIYDVPSRNMILAVWELGNEWKELTNGSISKEYGTQLEYIQKHWNESPYYLRDKQGEQKPTDNLEPKFKVGDWVVRNCKNNDTVIHKVVNIRLINDNCEIYGYELDDFTYVSGSFENEYRLWTIQDAKDGDVLATDNGGICIFDGTVEEGKYPFAYCGFTERGFEFYDRKLPFTHANVQPVTKEQRDLLFSKMKEAGYEWDAEKKELKKMKQKTTKLPKGEDYGIDSLYHAARILEKTLGEVEGYQSDDGILEHKCAIEAVNRLYKQKLAWSEKDEKMKGELICG